VIIIIISVFGFLFSLYKSKINVQQELYKTKTLTTPHQSLLGRSDFAHPHNKKERQKQHFPGFLPATTQNCILAIIRTPQNDFVMACHKQHR
jgi:hypothetical protein